MTTIEPIPSSQSEDGDLSPRFSDGEEVPQHSNDKPYFADTISNTRNPPQMFRDPRIHRKPQIKCISDERTLEIKAEQSNDKPYFVDTIPNTRNPPQMFRDPRIHRNPQIQYISDERTLGIEAPYQTMNMALSPRSNQK